MIDENDNIQRYYVSLVSISKYFARMRKIRKQSENYEVDFEYILIHACVLCLFTIKIIKIINLFTNKNNKYLKHLIINLKCKLYTWKKRTNVLLSATIYLFRYSDKILFCKLHLTSFLIFVIT